MTSYILRWTIAIGQTYERAGMKPFQPFDDKPMVMPYYEVPVDILEDRELLAEWARKSLFVTFYYVICLISNLEKKQAICSDNNHNRIERGIGVCRFVRPFQCSITAPPAASKRCYRAGCLG
jgi:hypothetical protein